MSNNNPSRFIPIEKAYCIDSKVPFSERPAVPSLVAADQFTFRVWMKNVKIYSMTIKRRETLTLQTI